jgi:hypothetical protein
MSSTLKRLAIVGLAAAAWLGTAGSSRAQIPTLVGNWEARLSYASCDNVLNPSSVPVFGSETGMLFQITHQVGRCFTAKANGGAVLMTGVIISTEQIIMDLYGNGDDRRMRCQVSVVTMPNGRRKMKGSLTEYEEVSVSPAHPYMSTGYFVAKELP